VNTAPGTESGLAHYHQIRLTEVKHCILLSMSVRWEEKVHHIFVFVTRVVVPGNLHMANLRAYPRISSSQVVHVHKKSVKPQKLAKERYWVGYFP